MKQEELQKNIESAERDIKIVKDCLAEDSINFRKAQKNLDSRIEQLEGCIEYFENAKFELKLFNQIKEAKNGNNEC